MKNIFVIISMVFFGYICPAQNMMFIDTTSMIYTYSYQFQRDSARLYSVGKQEMILQLGSHSSKFSSVNKLYFDSVMWIYDNKPMTQNNFTEAYNIVKGATIDAMCNYDVYKNYPEYGTLTFISRVAKTYYNIVQKSQFQWQLCSGEDTTVLGYKCHKALTHFAGRSYVAWFTPEIPVSDGPYKFGGLPGLIVKINDTKNQHSFTLTGVKRPKFKQPIFYNQKKHIKVTPQEYVKALNVNNSLRLEMLQSQEKIKPFNEESKIKAEHNIKSRNNFIERYQ